jgi:type III secretion protein T
VHIEASPDLLYLIILASARLGACLYVVPLFSARAIQHMTRLAIFVSLSLPFVVSVVLAKDAPALGLWTVMPILFKEIAIGILLGLPVAAIWWGLRSAGFLIDQQRSFGAAQAEHTALVEASTILGSAFEWAGTLVLLHSGAISLLVLTVYRSYGVWGLWEGYPGGGEEIWVALSACVQTMVHVLGLVAALPLLSILVMEIGVFLASRSAPNIASDILVLPIKLTMSAIFALFAFGYAVRNGDLQRLLHTPAAVMAGKSFHPPEVPLPRESPKR